VIGKMGRILFFSKNDCMKRRILAFLISLALLSIFGLQMSKKVSAEVNVHIGIVSSLPQVITTPPEVVLIPGTHVYFAPDVGMELFFYSGYWYHRHNGYWYRATYYNGPWVYLDMSRVPAVFVHLPKDYYNPPPGYQRISYGQMKKQWKKLKTKQHKHIEKQYKDKE